MTKAQAEKQLAKALAAAMEALGFRASHSLSYLRPHENRTDRIGFSVQKNRSGELSYGYGVGVIFPPINALLAGAGGGQASEQPTVGVPMHFLRASRAYFQWHLPTPVDPAHVIAEVEPDIRSYALPFLEEFASVEGLRAALERTDWSSRFTIDAQGRLERLVAIEFVQRGQPAALQTLARLVAERADWPRGFDRDLERLRKRLGDGVASQ